MSDFFVRADGAWSRVPRYVKVGAVCLALIALFVMGASPAFAVETDGNPFRWR